MKNHNFIITALVLPALLTSCMKSPKKEAQDPPPTAVNVLTLKSAPVQFYDSYPGTITALKEVGLRGEVTGYITGIYFTEGSRVHKGQELYEIDRRQYEAAYKQAADNLKIARENLDRIQKDVDRYSVLNRQEAIAKQQYDHALADLSNARTQVSVALQDQVKAEANFEYSVITAPFDGTIGISQVKMGDLIIPGQTLLNTISSDEPMGVDFLIDQSELRRFQEMEAKKPVDHDSTFSLVFPDNTPYMLHGKTGLIDRAVDPQTGTIRVRLVFPNPDNSLRPGMSCTVRVMHESAGPQILIPFKAVLEQMGEYFVFLADNNKAKETKIMPGPRVGSGVIIKEGLKEGDVIITEGIAKLSDGSAIAAGPPAPEGKPPKY